MRKIRYLLGESKEGSYTVEAALVMAVTLFLIASLLTEAFGTHSQVTGDMVLQDALEQAGHREAGTTAGQIAEEAGRDLSGYFRCGDMNVEIQEGALRIEGTVTGERGGSISVRWFDPEKFLRLLRAVGV